jgi:hypothetical protein
VLETYGWSAIGDIQNEGTEFVLSDEIAGDLIKIISSFSLRYTSLPSEVQWSDS